MTSVLIVEDQRMPRENMEHLVEDSGRYRRVASLSTAEMALAQCARHTVDLVLMDVCTKGSRDGIDVAAEIKARYPETKVIIITSMVEESYLKRAKAAGAGELLVQGCVPGEPAGGDGPHHGGGKPLPGPHPGDPPGAGQQHPAHPTGDRGAAAGV